VNLNDDGPESLKKQFVRAEDFRLLCGQFLLHILRSSSGSEERG
jgi:hypothetical protein